MRIQSFSYEWNLLGQDDPMWRVASVPGKRGKWTPEEFFATGRELVAQFLLKAGGGATGEALDFGCGVGRLTQALADHFPRVVGVDISASMLREATQCCSKPNVTFVHNETPRLPFEDGRFSLVVSYITLQHMPSVLAIGYIREFVRVTSPRGVVIFQIPTSWNWRSAGLRGSIEHFVPKRLLLAYHHFRYPGVGFSWVWGTPRKKVIDALRGVDVFLEEDSPPHRGWRSSMFFARKGENP